MPSWRPDGQGRLLRFAGFAVQMQRHACPSHGLSARGMCLTSRSFTMRDLYSCVGFRILSGPEFGSFALERHANVGLETIQARRQRLNLQSATPGWKTCAGPITKRSNALFFKGNDALPVFRMRKPRLAGISQVMSRSVSLPCQGVN